MPNQTNNTPSYTAPSTDVPTPSRIEKVFGLFRSQSTVPTVPARKLDEQIRLVNGNPYIYDNENNEWLPLGGTVTYAGQVNSDASTGSPFPIGWTVTKGTTGVYTVTHNLGTTNYALLAFAVRPNSIRPVMVLPYGFGMDSFEIRTLQENSGTAGQWDATDMAWHFTVIPA